MNTIVSGGLKLFIAGLIILSALAWSFNLAPTWVEFRKNYTPHYKLIAPENKAVKIVSYMEPGSIADIMEQYVKDSDKNMFNLIITSLERRKAGEVIDKMERRLAVKGFGFLDAEWQKEILWFVSEDTYNQISTKLSGLD